MALIIKSGMSIAEKKKMEKISADIAQLQADQDYIAMMADIDLEDEDE